MHSLTVDCDTFKLGKIAVVVSITSDEVAMADSKMFAINFSTLLLQCLMKKLRMSALGQMVG